MKKSILILPLILVISQLKAMDDNLKTLEIDQAIFAKEKDKFAQWGMIKDAYLKLEKNKFSYSSEKWLGISDAYAKLVQEYVKDPFWRNYLNSGKVGPIGEAVSFMKDIEEFLTSDQLILYVDGMLKLIDASIQEGEAEEAESLIEVGLEINDKLYNAKKIASNMRDKFLGKQAKVKFAIWNKGIQRAEKRGDVQHAYSYAQEVLKTINNDFKDYNSKYPQEMKQLQTKMQTLNQEIEDIKKVHKEVNLAMMTYTFQNEAHKFLVISDRLAPLAKRDKNLRDWIVDIYLDSIHSNIDNAAKIKISRQMLEYENEWQGLDFVSHKTEIEELLKKLESKVLANEKNLFEALKQLIRSFSALQSKLLKG